MNIIEGPIDSIIPIENRILVIRGLAIMLDRDLAELYSVETKRINEQVKRNRERFPKEFMFQLTEEEVRELVAKCDRFGKLKHSSSLPYAFTEQGVAMLSSVLHSKVAIEVSICIINAFVSMRRLINSQSIFSDKIEKLERRQYAMEVKIEKISERNFSHFLRWLSNPQRCCSAGISLQTCRFRGKFWQNKNPLRL